MTEITDYRNKRGFMGVEIPMSSAVTRMLQIRGGKIHVIQRGEEYWMQCFYRYFIRFDTMQIPILLTKV